MEQAHCQIEQHAVLYGLLARGAIEYGPAGRKALEAATREYGLTRGRRMAQYALQEGLSPCGENYTLFQEWRPLPGQICSGESALQPRYITTTTRCEWTESWKKHGLLEYGKTYCAWIDQSLYQGYQSKYTLTVRSTLSAGDPACCFDWEFPRTPEAAAWIKQKKEELGERYVRDFDFHTADLLRVVCRVLEERMGGEGQALCRAAWKEFGELFGEGYCEAIQSAARRQGWESGLPWVTPCGAEA